MPMRSAFAVPGPENGVLRTRNAASEAQYEEPSAECSLFGLAWPLRPKWSFTVIAES